MPAARAISCPTPRLRNELLDASVHVSTVGNCVRDSNELLLFQIASDETLDETLSCRIEPLHRRLAAHLPETQTKTPRREVIVNHEGRGSTHFVLATNAAVLLLFVGLVPPAIPMRHVLYRMAET